ncbi:hypothetical protein V8F20_005182 [Naviculisporaceae sp. PSN 640]
MDNTFWATLAPKIQTWTAQGATAEIEEIQCPICQESDLVIHGFDPQRRTSVIAPDQDQSTPRNHENAMVLHCGHILGASCSLQWREICARNFHPFTCPLCRDAFDTKRCRQHDIEVGLVLDKPDDGRQEDSFAVVMARVEEFIQDACRKREAARSCSQCTATGLNMYAGDLAEPEFSFAVPEIPAARYRDPTLTDEEVAAGVVENLRASGLADLAREWEEYRANLRRGT